MLFADHGLSTAQISSLLAIWSVTAFVLEVPSGAWADTVSRRLLLVLGAVLLVAGFGAWTVFPGYVGFAAGFVLWGISGALQSGTFEALLYDELLARGGASGYPRILGFSRAAAESCSLVATLTAAPLYALGGYALVGWASVAAAGVHVGCALSLPGAPRAASVADVEDLEAGDEPVAADRPRGGYLAMLRAGTTEFAGRPRVRFGVLLAALLFGFTAFDEYFGLLGLSTGVSVAMIPLLAGLATAGQVLGTALAGRTANIRARVMAGVLVVAAGLFAAGALLGGPGVLGALGFAAIGLAYGAISNAVIVTEARLQDAIEGPARATVTSVSGLLSEVVSLGVFAAVALGSVWWSLSVVLALLAVPVLLAAGLVPRWLPKRNWHAVGTSGVEQAG